jgi:hypothetical protein
MSFSISQYHDELTAVIRTNDKEKILSFLSKRGVPAPSTDEAFQGAIHKMRLSLPTFTEEEKAESREWLREHGMRASGPVPENLQRHMQVFDVSMQAALARGLSEDAASVIAAREANEAYPLTEEDKKALRFAGQAWASVRGAGRN